jgi:hypothetical protein
MEALVVIMGLLGLAQQRGMLPQQQHPQVVQQYYNPQTGRYYIYYNGYMYEQNVSQYQGYQNQPSQNMGATYGTPQPPNGQWYPQQPTQTATNPQGYYR